MTSLYTSESGADLSPYPGFFGLLTDEEAMWLQHAQNMKSQQAQLQPAPQIPGVSAALDAAAQPEPVPGVSNALQAAAQDDLAYANDEAYALETAARPDLAPYAGPIGAPAPLFQGPWGARPAANLREEGYATGAIRGDYSSILDTFANADVIPKIGASGLEFDSLSDTYNWAQGPARQSGAAIRENVPGLPGRALGGAAEFLLDPLTIAGAGMMGTGLIPELLGRGAATTVPRYIASSALAGAGGPVAEELGAPPIVGNVIGGLSPFIAPATLRAGAGAARNAPEALGRLATEETGGVKIGGLTKAERDKRAKAFLSSGSLDPETRVMREAFQSTPEMSYMAEGMQYDATALGLPSRETLSAQIEALRANPKGKTAELGKLEAQQMALQAIETNDAVKAYDQLADAYSRMRGPLPVDRARIAELERIIDNMIDLTELDAPTLNWNAVRQVETPSLTPTGARVNNQDLFGNEVYTSPRGENAPLEQQSGLGIGAGTRAVEDLPLFKGIAQPTVATAADVESPAANTPSVGAGAAAPPAAAGDALAEVKAEFPGARGNAGGDVFLSREEWVSRQPDGQWLYRNTDMPQLEGRGASALDAIHDARQQARGTGANVAPPTAAAGAGGIPPKEPPTATGGADEFAANIRLSKYPEEVRSEIKGWADANPQAVDAARRGIQGNEVTREAARQLVEDMGGKFDKIQKRWKPGEAWNAEEVVAIRGVLNQRTEEVLEAAKAARGGDITAQARLMMAIEEQARVQQIVHGVTAEAGRALRAFRVSADEALLNSDVSRLRQILERTAKGSQIEDIADALSKIDLNNPAAVNNFLRSLQKPELWDYVRELWINSVLSGPATHMVNILSNAANTMVSPVERGLAAAADLVVAPIQGRARERFFSEVKADAFGAMQAIPEATKAMFIALRDGISPASATKLEVRKQAFRGPVGTVIRAPGTALEAMDSFFYTLNYRAALNANIMRQARGEGLTGQSLIERIAELQSQPSYGLIKGARETAEYRVFREPSDLASSIIRMREKNPALQFFIPFVRTPTNILKFGIERSPLGFYDAIRQVAKGNPQAADKMARAAMGSIIAGGIAWQFGEGNITAAPPKNAAERDRFYREGKQPYSLKIGGKWVSYQKLEPFNQPIAQVAAAIEALKDKDATAEQKIGLTITTIADNLVSQSYLTGISGFINALTEPDRYAGSLLTRTATGFQPYSSASRFATRLSDDTVRKPKTLKESFKAQIPGLSKEVPPRLDAFGNEVKRQSSPLSPISVTSDDQSRVDAELERLGVEVGFVGDSIRSVPLSREEQQAWQVAAGKITYQVFQQLLNDASYQGLTDDVKARAFERAKNKARDVAQSEFLRQLSETRELVPAGSR